MAVNFDNVVGTGTILDGGYAGRLIALTLLHLGEARDSGQITDGMVGEVYATTLSSSISQAIQFELSSVKQADATAVSDKNVLVLAAQEALYIRQKEGFDDNKNQKVLDSALGAWGITYQDAAESLNIPNHLISSTSGAHIGLEKLFDNAMSNVRDSTVDEPATVN